MLAATPALTERVDAGTFGDVLFYKISALALSVPALCETRTDIPMIAQRILQHARTAGGATLVARDFTPDATGWFQLQEWAGGYAELKRTVLAAAMRAAHERLTSTELETALRNPDDAAAVIESAALSFESVAAHS